MPEAAVRPRLNVPLRGPNGQHKPATTPAYGTPATRTAVTPADVNTLLPLCGSGEVIEVTGDWTGLNPVITGAPSSGNAMDVLVRPPLGQRRAVGSLDLRAPRVCMAGFDTTTISYIRTATAVRASFWRCTSAHGAFSILGAAGADCSLVELVLHAKNVAVEADRMNIFSDAAGNLVRPSVVGCWVNHSTLPQGSLAHQDALQIEGVVTNVIDWRVYDSVLGGASNSAAQLQALMFGDAMFVNNWCGPATFYSAAFGRADSTSGNRPRFHVVGNDFVMGPNLDGPAASLLTYRNNRSGSAPSGVGISAEVTAGSNSVGPVPYASTIYPLGDLTKLWPECPSSVTPDIVTPG